MHTYMHIRKGCSPSMCVCTVLPAGSLAVNSAQAAVSAHELLCCLEGVQLLLRVQNCIHLLGMTEIRAWPKGNMDATSSRPWGLRAQTYIFGKSVSLFSDSLCKQHTEDRGSTHKYTHTVHFLSLKEMWREPVSPQWYGICANWSKANGYEQCMENIPQNKMAMSLDNSSSSYWWAFLI